MSSRYKRIKLIHVKYKQPLFIYSRKEIIVLLFLAFMIALFTFTLGVHFGKRVGPTITSQGIEATSNIATVSDQVPNRVELAEQGKWAQQSLDDTLNEELREEVTKTGIKLDVPRQLALPEHPKSTNAGATTLTPPSSKHAQPQRTRTQTHASSQPHSQKQEQEQENKHPASTRTPASHKSVESKQRYALQIGSYPTLNEVKKQLAALEHEQKDLRPFWREAEIHGKGKWYRLYVGSFNSKNAAEEAGQKYQTQHMIDSFIVAKIID